MRSRKSCVCLSNAGAPSIAFFGNWAGKKRSPKQLEFFFKTHTSFSPCLCLCLPSLRCQSAMPRPLLPSRATTAWFCLSRPGKPFSASMAAGSLWSPRPARQKASPPSPYTIPSRTVPAVRGRTEQRHFSLALLSAKNILRTKRRCLIAYRVVHAPALAVRSVSSPFSVGGRVVAKQALFMASMSDCHHHLIYVSVISPLASVLLNIEAVASAHSHIVSGRVLYSV